MKPKLTRSAGSVYRYARDFLLALIVLTVANCVFLLLGNESYFVDSIMAAFYLFFLWLEEYDFPFLLGVIVPVLIVAAYTACYFLSKRKSIWMIIALVLLALDTLFVFYLIYAAYDYYYTFGEALLLYALDLVIHIAGLVILALAVKNRKIGTMTDQELTQAGTAAGVAAARIESTPQAAEKIERMTQSGLSPEVQCLVSILEPGKKIPSTGEGVVRFETAELVIGGRSMASQMLVGRLASMKELARVGYQEIGPVTAAGKKQKSFSLPLPDGRTATVAPGGKNDQQRFYDLMVQHGVTMPPQG